MLLIRQARIGREILLNEAAHALFTPNRQCATMRIILLRRFAVKKLIIAVGVLIVAMAFELAPFYEHWLGWLLFVVLLLFGAYTIYDAIQNEK